MCTCVFGVVFTKYRALHSFGKFEASFNVFHQNVLVSNHVVFGRVNTLHSRVTPLPMEYPGSLTVTECHFLDSSELTLVQECTKITLGT